MQNIKLAGVTSVYINGSPYKLVSDLSYDPITSKARPLMGMDGDHGYAEEPKYGTMTMTLRDGGKLVISQLASLRNATVQIMLANGKVIVGSNMMCVTEEF